MLNLHRRNKLETRENNLGRVMGVTLILTTCPHENQELPKYNQVFGLWGGGLGWGF